MVKRKGYKMKKYIIPSIKISGGIETETLMVGSGNRISEDGTEVTTGDTSEAGDASGAYGKTFSVWDYGDTPK